MFSIGPSHPAGWPEACDRWLTGGLWVVRNVDTLIATSNYYFNNLDISNYRLEKYKNRSIQISIQQLQNNNLSIDKVRNWDSYYDRNGKRNYYAYNVGSSFIFYLFDSHRSKPQPNSKCK